VVKRFPEATAVVGNQPLARRLEGQWKVFDLTCSAFEWQIDAQKAPVQARLQRYVARPGASRD